MATNSAIGTLKVCVVEAESLPQMDFLGGADPVRNSSGMMWFYLCALVATTICQLAAGKTAASRACLPAASPTPLVCSQVASPSVVDADGQP